MLLPVLLGIGLGLSLAAPPGPMNAIIARESARHGAGAGMVVGLGAPVADLVYLAILVAAREVLLTPGLLLVAAAVGSAIMMAFCWGTLFGKAAQADTPRTSFAAGFVTAMTNPYQIAWWLSGGFVFLQAQGWWGIGGLIVGIFGWVVGFSLLVARGAQKWPWFAPTIKWGSAIMLGAFSLVLALVALQVIGLTV